MDWFNFTVISSFIMYFSSWPICSQQTHMLLRSKWRPFSSESRSTPATYRACIWMLLLSQVWYKTWIVSEEEHVDFIQGNCLIIISWNYFHVRITCKWPERAFLFHKIILLCQILISRTSGLQRVELEIQ